MMQPAYSPKCPFCLGFMADWGTRAPAKHCELCDRPLVLLPASFRIARFRIVSLVDALKIVILPFIGAGLVSFVLGRISVDAFAGIVALSLLAWGAIDVWDGTAGMKTGIDRVRRQIRRGSAARRMSIAKTIFGLASILFGALGLLMVA